MTRFYRDKLERYLEQCRMLESNMNNESNVPLGSDAAGVAAGAGTAQLLELHGAIKDHIADLAAQPTGPHTHPSMAVIPGFIVSGLVTAAEAFVPMLAEMALSKVGGPVEAVIVSHKDAIVQWVGPKALEYAAKLIQDLQGLNPAKPA